MNFIITKSCILVIVFYNVVFSTSTNSTTRSTSTPTISSVSPSTTVTTFTEPIPEATKTSYKSTEATATLINEKSNKSTIKETTITTIEDVTTTSKLSTSKTAPSTVEPAAEDRTTKTPSKPTTTEPIPSAPTITEATSKQTTRSIISEPATTHTSTSVTPTSTTPTITTPSAKFTTPSPITTETTTTELLTTETTTHKGITAEATIAHISTSISTTPTTTSTLGTSTTSTSTATTHSLTKSTTHTTTKTPVTSKPKISTSPTTNTPTTLVTTTATTTTPKTTTKPSTTKPTAATYTPPTTTPTTTISPSTTTTPTTTTPITKISTPLSNTTPTTTTPKTTTPTTKISTPLSNTKPTTTTPKTTATPSTTTTSTTTTPTTTNTPISTITEATTTEPLTTEATSTELTTTSSTNTPISTTTTPTSTTITLTSSSSISTTQTTPSPTMRPIYETPSASTKSPFTPTLSTTTKPSSTSTQIHTDCMNILGTFLRPNVSLGEDCGDHSIDGICEDQNSFCDDKYGTWICRCKLGYAERNSSCDKVPGRIFQLSDKDIAWHMYSASYDLTGVTVIHEKFSELVGFNVTSVNFTLLGKDSKNFTISVWDLQVSIEVIQNLFKSRYVLTAFSTVTIGDIILHEALTVTLNIYRTYYDLTLYVMDGTPNNTWIGGINNYNDYPHNLTFSHCYDISYKSLSIDMFGNIYTKYIINLDILWSRSSLVLGSFCDIQLNSDNHTYHVGTVNIIIVRNVYQVADPIVEDSNGIFPIGSLYGHITYNSFNLQHSHFVLQYHSILLRNMTLDFQETPEVNETIILTIDDTTFEIAVRFKVQDTNDKTPYFTQEQYKFITTQTAPKGMIVGVVEAVDPDTNSSLVYTITPNDILDIDIKGIITLKQNITTNHYAATVTVDDGIHSNTTEVVIIGVQTAKAPIKTTDDKQPKRRFFGNVTENALKGNIVTVFIRGLENYKFTDSQANSNFKLDNKTGIIANSRQFDRENPGDDRFRYTVTANHIGQSCSLEIVGEVIIDVVDANDNPPEFLHTPYVGEILEETPIQPLQLPFRIETSDKDLDKTVTFSLENNTSTFVIDRIKGNISTIKAIDRETLTSLNITVVASDGVNVVREKIQINVVDINDNRPHFTFVTNFTLYENVSLGSVSRVSAIDSDSGVNAEISFDISSRGGYFQINQKSGDILLAEPLDREKISEHKLNVIARDHGNPSMSATVELWVKVLDINDNASKFSEREITIYIEENNNCSIPLLNVTASDDDEEGPNSQVNYSFVGKYDDLVITSNGTISCVHPFDYENRENYRIYVTAIDSGTPPKSSTQALMIAIQIRDKNDNTPSFEYVPNKLTIRFFDPIVERVVSVINAIDRDSGDNGRLSYNVSGNASKFLTIDGRGVLRTNGTRPLNGIYRLDISIRDHGYPVLSNSTCMEVEVSIGSNLTQPVRFTKQIMYMSVFENKPTGTSLGNVSSSVSSTVSKNLSYEIVDVTANLPFHLIKANGIVKTTKILDRETKDHYEFVVRVIVENSSQDLSDLALVNVKVLDVNDNSPEFNRTEYYFQVNENEAVGFFIKPSKGYRKISAFDVDDGNNSFIYYNLVDDKVCNSSFSINQDTGQLQLEKEIDYEEMTICKLNITAYNPSNESMPSFTNVTIQITDYNDNAPVFHGHHGNKFTICLLENTTANFKLAPFGNITDRDDRENGDVAVFVQENCSFTVDVDKSKYNDLKDGENVNTFELSLKLIEPLDYETGEKNITCTIVGADKAVSPNPKLSSSATVVIQVIDINDNYPIPEMKEFWTNISRYADAGEIILERIIANDLDEGNNGEIYFHFDQKYKFSSYFEIDPTCGQIKLNSKLIEIPADKIILFVTVSDKGSPQLSTTVMVKVQIEDDNPRPYFKGPLIEKIQEHSIRQDGLIYTIKAYDNTTDGTVKECDCSYTMDITDGLYKDRIILTLDGQIKFNDSLDSFDRERVPGGVLSILITATDYGDPPKSTERVLTIEIVDINDQAPIFEKNQYHFEVFQKAPYGTIIGNVHAEDKDQDPYTLYSVDEIESDFKDNTVTIDKIKGSIYKIGDMTLPQPRDYQIKIVGYAEDGKDANKPKDDVIITITVRYNDTNRHAPYFLGGPFEESIPWNQETNTNIVQITAVDNDEGDDGSVAYRIVEGNKRGFFSIDDSGWISLDYTLDSSLGDDDIVNVNLLIEARDQGAIQNISNFTTEVKIFIVGSGPEECILGSSHQKQISELKREKVKYSYALYGLSGALCLTIFTTFVFIYKWRSFYKLNSHQDFHGGKSQERYISGQTQYESLGQSPHQSTPYSASNQQFDPVHDEQRLHRPIPSLSFSPPNVQRAGSYIEFRDPNELLPSPDLRFLSHHANVSRDHEPMPDYD